MRTNSDLVMADYILENLPLAPTVNNVWKHRAVRRTAMVYMSAEGVKFRATIVKIAKEKRLYNLKLESRLEVKIELFMPDKRKRDVDNFSKSTLDALTHAGLWLDDSQVDILTLVRCAIVKGGAMNVFIKELEK
jgi:crossover junction endodeoxyribonuclease RusA